MDINLTLLPFDYDSPPVMFSHTVLPMKYDREIYGEIQKIEAHDIGAGFNSYLCRSDDIEESHFGETLQDAYGDSLKYVFAYELVAIGMKAGAAASPAFAYLAALPRETKVALFWS